MMDMLKENPEVKESLNRIQVKLLVIRVVEKVAW